MKNKILYFFLFIGLYSFGQGQVGINTPNPKATLDVEGTLRVGELAETSASRKSLAVDEQGNVVSITRARTYTTSVTINPTRSVLVTIPENFKSANLFVLTSNQCSRQMIAYFQTYAKTLVYVRAVARDKFPTITNERLIVNSTRYTQWIRLVFDVIGCNADGGSTQFNFTIEKRSANQYVLTNNGDVIRTYTLIWNELD